jgi:hypothetical protein
MPFVGTLRDNELFILDVTPAVQSGVAPAAVTVSYLNATGNKIRDIDIFTIQIGDPQAGISRVIPKDTTRLYIEIDLSSSGFAQARVVQGATVYSTDIAADARLVFDVL